MKDEIIKIKFSNRYENGLKISRIIPFLPLPIVIIVLLLIRASFIALLIMIVITTIIGPIGLWIRLKSEGELPLRVKINKKGIYAWKRNKKEENISWDDVVLIRELDSLTPEEHIVIKKDNIKDLYPNDLILDNNSTQIAKSKFEEYKTKKGIIS